MKEEEKILDEVVGFAIVSYYAPGYVAYRARVSVAERTEGILVAKTNTRKQEFVGTITFLGDV